MADRDGLRQHIHHAVHQLITRICAHNYVVAQRLRLGATDSRILALLTLHGSLTPGRLAGFTGLSTGAVTGVIDRLERAQMVRRDRNPADRRSVHVTSTPAATARIAVEYTDWVNVLNTALQHRNPVELATIAHFLTDLTDSDNDSPLNHPDRSQTTSPGQDRV
jgi:DNA-binding MarR family transcriptional regulator